MVSSKRNEIERILNEFGKQKDDNFDFESISEYFNKRDNSSCFQIISEKVCNDLDFNELFKFIDRTNSRVGQQFLYNRLRTIPLEQNIVAENEKIIESLLTDKTLRQEIQKLLLKLKDNESFYISSLFQDKHIKPPKWFFIAHLLSFTMTLSLLLLTFNSLLIILITLIFITNIVIHYWNKRNLYQYLYSIPRLLVLNAVAKRLNSINELKNINPNIESSIAVIDRIKNRTSFFKLELNLQNDFAVLLWSILELLKIAFLLEPIMLFSAINHLETRRKEIENVYSYVGSIDVLLSVASLRMGLGKYCIPKISVNSKKVNAVNLYHPLIKGCVKNSITINGKSVLLTGSNMSGKTSFIRTIGINSICALTLNTCFADEFEIQKQRIYSAIRISDDLLNNKSYYFEEVLTIKEMIDHSNENAPNLFLLDEIFKGTNTIERISAGKAVLSSLAKKNSTTFVSTHDIELAELLNEEYELYHFSEIVDNYTVAFDYRLKNGKLKNRNAIRILQLNDYPKEIIDEAMKIAKELDNI
jgi:DNA mismatch repair ATPase MutS